MNFDANPVKIARHCEQFLQEAIVLHCKPIPL